MEFFFSKSSSIFFFPSTHSFFLLHFRLLSQPILLTFNSRESISIFQQNFKCVAHTFYTGIIETRTSVGVLKTELKETVGNEANSHGLYNTMHVLLESTRNIKFKWGKLERKRTARRPESRR
jgi:hypothetical protein